MTSTRKQKVPKFAYDYFGLAGPQQITLYNPNEIPLYSLGPLVDRKIIARFNSFWEFSFKAYKMIDSIKMPYYDYLQQRRVIKIDNVGLFLITKVTEETDGVMVYKNVECQSYETILQTRRIIKYISGASSTGDPQSVTLSELMNGMDGDVGIIEAFMPDWEIPEGGIPDSLSERKRAFDISNKTVYDFLINDIEEAYGCTIRFSTTEWNQYYIYFEDTEEEYTHSGIYMSLENVIENIQIEEIADELATCLHVTGAGGLDISLANPMGNNYIYNFNYFNDSKWMSNDLREMVTAWETAFDELQNDYYYIVYDIARNYDIIASSELSITLYREWLAEWEVNLQTAIYTGADTSTALIWINSLNSAIENRLQYIDTIQGYIDDYIEQKIAINNALSLNSWEGEFTPVGYEFLLPFIIESSYTNNNIILTDSMSMKTQYEQSQELYNKAIEVLAKTASPKYSFTLNSVNFMAISEFSSFQNDLRMGIDVLINYDGKEINAYLTEMSINFDDLNDFSITFANRMRPENPNTKFTDIINTAISAGETTKLKELEWDNWTNNYKSTVASFVTSELNTTLNPVIDSDKENIKIAGSGIIGRNKLSSTLGDYADKQLWIIKDKIFTTTDGWKTYKEVLSSTLTSTLATGITTLDSLTPELNMEEYGISLNTTVGTLPATRISSGSTIGVNLRGTSASLNVTTGCFVTDVIYANNIYGNMAFGDLTVNNDIMLGGGISVGDTTYNPPTNVLAGLGDGRFAGGVMAGGSTTNITNGDFYSTGSTTTHGITSVGGIDTTTSIRAVGGIYVGSWGTPTTDDIIADGSIEAGTSITAGRNLTISTGSLVIDEGDMKTDYGGIYAGDNTGTTANPNVGDIWITDDARLGGGLYVGGTATNPTPGLIQATGNILLDGGLYVGNSTGTAVSDVIIADDDVRLGGGLSVGSTTTNVPDGVIYTNDGGVNPPAYTFRNDPNTGFYRAAEDNIGIATAGTERGRFNNSGLFLNDSANTFQTYGVTINNSSSTDHVFSYKQTGINHDMTNLAETDTMFAIGPVSTSTGGTRLYGFGNSYIGHQIIGLVDIVESTRSTSAQAPIVLQGNLSDDAGGSGALGSNMNTLVIRNYGTTRFIFDSDGDFHLDAGGGTGGTIHGWAYDEYDDAQLIRAFEINRPTNGIVKDQFDKWIEYNRDDLERLDIATFNDDTDGHVFVNLTKLSYLQNGAIWQLYKKLQKMEQALLNAGINPELLSEEI